MPVRVTAIIACAILLAVPATALAGHPMPAVTFPQEHSVYKADPSELFGRLPNGMTYVIERNATPPGTASIRMRVRAGSMMEADDQKGLAHFVEHMAFEGTTHIPHGALKPMLERDGFTFGADANAFTTDEATTYMLDAPKNDGGTLDQALFIMREIAGNMTIDPTYVDSERGVVLSEERRDDNPVRRRDDALNTFIYSGLRFAGHNEAIGSADIVRGASAADLARFYRTWYRPELTTLVIVGDVDPKAMEKAIRAKFAGWKASTPPPDEPDWGTYQPKGPRVFTYVAPGINRQLGAIWVQPQDTRPDGPERTIQSIEDGMLIELLSRRFAVAQPDAQSFFVQLAYGASYKTSRNIQVNILAKPGKTKEAFDQVWERVRTFIDQGVTPDEIALAQSLMAGRCRDFAKSYATRDNSDIASSILYDIDADLVDRSPVDQLQTNEVAAAELTRDKLNARMKVLFSGDGPVFTDWASDSVADFPADEVVGEYSRLFGTKAQSDAGQAPKSWPYADFGAPVPPAAHTVDRDFGFGHYVFPNGVVLNVKSDTFSAGQVLVLVSFAGGVERFDVSKPRPLFLATSELFSAGGLGKLEASDVQRVLAGKVASATYNLAMSRTTLYGATTSDDLATQMQLLMAYTVDPGLRDGPYRNSQAYIPEYLKTLRSTPDGVLNFEMRNVFTPNDWRFDNKTMAEASSISWADVAPIYRESLKDTPITITITGDVDEARAVKAVAATFATLPPRPASAPHAAGSDVIHFPPAGHEFVFTHDGRADQNISVAVWPTTDYYSDTKQARGLAVLAGIIQSRLYDQLREHEGADYSPQAFSFNDLDLRGYGYLQVTATVKASDDALFRDILRGIVADLKAHPPTADEITRVTAPLLLDAKTSRKTNAYWFDIVDSLATYPQGRQSILDYAGDIKAVDGTTVMTLARTWLKDDTEIHVTVKPAPKAPEAPVPPAPDKARPQ